MVQSIDRAMDILELFINEKSLRAIEIAQKVGLHINTTRNLLLTLEKRGYLCRVEPFRYGLGCQCRVLGDNCTIWDDLKRISEPHMILLAKELGNNIFLSSEKNGKLFCINLCAGNATFLISHEQKWMNQLHCTASGKILLAYGKERLWHTLKENTPLPRFTKQTITEIDKLEEECNAIAKEGWVLTSCESVDQVSSLAVGIFNGNHEIIAALSEYFPKFYLENGTVNIAEHVKSLRNTAQKIAAEYNVTI